MSLTKLEDTKGGLWPRLRDMFRVDFLGRTPPPVERVGDLPLASDVDTAVVLHRVAVRRHTGHIGPAGSRDIGTGESPAAWAARSAWSASVVSAARFGIGIGGSTWGPQHPASEATFLAMLGSLGLD